MPLTLISAPTAVPVSLDDAKLFLRVDGGAEDALITALAAGAREAVENFVHRALMPQTWQLVLDCFPAASSIRLPLPPLQSVSSVKYYDVDGVQQTFAAASHQVSVAGDQAARIVLADGAVWPVTETGRIEAVEIQFVAGYADAAAVPPTLVMAMKAMIAGWYEQRLPAGQRGVGDLAGALFPYVVPLL